MGLPAECTAVRINRMMTPITYTLATAIHVVSISYSWQREEANWTVVPWRRLLEEDFVKELGFAYLALEFVAFAMGLLTGGTTVLN